MISHPPIEPFTPNRNEPCFCGSGQKFKRCCGSLSPDREPPHGVIVRQQWLDQDACQELEAYLVERRSLKLKVHNPKTGQDELQNVRVAEQLDLGERRDQINKHVESAYTTVAEPSLKCRLDWFSSPVVMRYSAGGFYSRHSDSIDFDPATRQWRKMKDRDVSLLLYLNEDYEGGAITFVNFNYSHQPRTGDLLIFPSDHRYAHEAERVLSGHRYAIVSWAAKRGEPRVESGPPKGAIFLHDRSGDAEPHED